MSSFSVQTKNELCRVPVGQDCCRRAELYGMLLFSAAFSNRQIRVTSSHAPTIRRAAEYLQRVFCILPEESRAGGRYCLEINEPDHLQRVLNGLGYDFRSYLTYHLNRNLVEEPCCAASFLRGAFLMSGSVASPDKKSHLEMKSSHAVLCREVMSLLLDNGMEPKLAVRGSGQLLYWKDTQRIEDFLTRIGASRAAMDMMAGKVEKQMRNSINRQVNCETANLSKVTEASAKQIVAIERALARGGIEVFPENLQETVDLRVAHPTASLSELAAMFDPPISKPGLNHRLRRIMGIAEREGEVTE